MRINTEEIARLLRVASSPIRENWEKIRNDGKNLFVLQSQREQLNTRAESYNKKLKILSRLQTVLVFLGLLESIPFGMWVVHIKETADGKIPLGFIALVVVIIFPVIMLNIGHSILTRKFENASTDRTQCDVVFDKFQRSIDALNPMGIGNRYHDVITEQYVTNMTRHLALRVLDAEQRFEESRLNLNEARYNVVHNGNWIEKCQNDFEGLWRVATNDFGLKLDKSSIFKQAATELARRNI